MSWLVANWFGVLAMFGAPAIVGVFGWLAVLTARRTAERHARERAARRHIPVSLSRTAHRS